jgi:hypothetical protein
MPAPSFGKTDQSATGESGGRKKALWLVLFLAVFAGLGSYVAVIAYVRFGGQVVKDFCSRELIGKSAAEAKQHAARSGLEIVEREGMLRVTTDRNMSRHTCDLKLDAGKVKSAKAYFRF